MRSAHDSVQVRFVDTDLRAVIQALGHYLPKPVIVGAIQPTRVSLETPTPVPPQELPSLLRTIIESQGLAFDEDSVAFRVGVKPPPVATPPTVGSGQAGQGPPVQLFVIRLKHARAGDVAATVNQLFGGTGEFSGAGGLSTGTLSDELRRNRVPYQGNGTAPSSPPPGASFRGSVTIVPDELTNSLLVRASPADFDVLKQAVDQLDIRPLQVLIEVLIVEAQHNRNFSIGTSFLVPPQSIDHGTGTAQGSTTGGSLGDFVLQLLNVGHAKVDATLTAAASRGDVQIISRPVLLASNNTEAHILVGSQQPFIQVSRSLPTDTPTRDQVVQYEPVGTKLTVRPTINEDGYVSLVIQQEVSSATDQTAFGAPVISTREASTQVLVRDGQTIVLGGLRDQEHDQTQGGVPILSSIPLLGGLFGSASRTRNQTEFYLFLTPRILRTDADADSATAPHLPAGKQQ
ncbi:MAG TPA: secretin N-terminal domain-containing protein [Gemmatimonadales bacterium]|nr:secretin N-terminal domain-containing protein [Gemmatimonadales bacterium]